METQQCFRMSGQILSVIITNPLKVPHNYIQLPRVVKQRASVWQLEPERHGHRVGYELRLGRLERPRNMVDFCFIEPSPVFRSIKRVALRQPMFECARP